MKKATPCRNPVSLAALTKLGTWKQVEKLLENVQKVPANKRTADERILAGFHVSLEKFCPRYDFSRDSVQKRLLEEFGSHGEAEFRNQEEKRLFAGFKRACLFAFGRNWKNRSTMLREFYILREIEQTTQPESLPGIESVLLDALKRRDREFFNRLGKVIDPRLSEGSKKIGGADITMELARNWTNPDCPLWLMTDTAVQQLLRYLTGGAEIEHHALQKKLRRLKLQRYHRQAITATKIEVKAESLLFEGYSYRPSLAPKLKGVIVKIPKKSPAIVVPDNALASNPEEV